MARSMGRTDGHVITNGIVIGNIMFGVCVADCRRVRRQIDSESRTGILNANRRLHSLTSSRLGEWVLSEMAI
jgi:hypothetical protein